MTRAALAGSLYFLTTFAVGFALGVIRALAVAPHLGALAAVLLELPLMLGASWFLSAVITRRLAIAPYAPPRLVMGATGFVLLMAAEYLLGRHGFGLDLNQQLRQFTTAPGALGLLGQALFAVIPVLQGLQRSSN